ncbi:GldG family protein [Caldicoprobacter algeriensis]|uniref:GldG family protein n=1 Tax=Caldicoprobacter algeriensis TaxID=699281 RepID=UPI002079D514|nr:GldG family protein [Caldicoprobacter algeriensis]MCM8900959.1 GldG family protein [Caldicoprobacter algeriensis]
MKKFLGFNFRSVKESFKSKKFKYGGYATLMVAVVIAIAIIINLIVDQIPWEVDLTQNQMYSLSEQTNKVLDNLKQDVKIIGLYETGEEDKTVLEIIERYQKRSKRISFTTVDPERYPQLLTKYEKGGESLNAGSLIVESGDKFKVIDRYDLVNYSYNQYSGQWYAQSLAVEQRLTGAILYVTTEELPVVYTLVGHGEDSIPYDVRKQLELENYTIEDLNLVTQDSVPEKAHALVVLSPKRDITKEEEEKIRKYLENQGRAIFFIQNLNEELPNFESLLKSYGVALQRVVVVEGDANMHYPGNPLYIIPNMESHSILSPLKSGQMYVFAPQSQSIEVLEMKRRTLEIEPLLVTSDKAWAKTNLEATTIEKEEGDLEGPFNIAVAITDKIYEDNETKETRLVVVANTNLLNSQLVSQVPGNVNFLLNSLNWLQDREENISIRPKSLTTSRLRISAYQQLIFSGIVVILIPLIVLASGLTVWLRRRHL